MSIAISIFIIFMATSVLCFLENRLYEKDKKLLYVLIAIILILLAGFREVGVDPDSPNYEYAFHHYDDIRLWTSMEPSFFLLSAVFSFFSSDVHSIFLFYAFCGVVLKFIAFRRLTLFWFLPIIVYISFIYELHELTQIRTGLMSGLFLLTIPYIAEKKRIKAIILIITGAIFHMSALALLPFVFFSNKEMSVKNRIIWITIIPLSYVIYFIGNNFLVNIPIAYVENKITNYEKTSDIVEAGLNVFSPLQIFTIFIYLYLMYFYDTIKKHNKYFPLMMKIFTLSIASFSAFAFLPVMANRLSYLFRIVTIILFTYIYYTIKPRYVGILVVIFISIVYIFYTYSYIFGIKLF